LSLWQGEEVDRTVWESYFFRIMNARDALPLVKAQNYSLPKPFNLEGGKVLEGVNIRYETYGQLNATRSNAILIHHAFTGDAHAAGKHKSTDKYPGWWDTMIGPGKALDTDKYFILSTNVLVGCGGTTGPASLNPATGKVYGLDFPTVSILDMVNLQKVLVDHLQNTSAFGRDRWIHGRDAGLEWTVTYPEKVRSGIILASTHRLSPQGIAFHAVGRNAIFQDPYWKEGNYSLQGDQPTQGLAIARMIGHITYLSDESMRSKFGRRVKEGVINPFTGSEQFEVEGYLLHQGNKFVKRFDANSYIYLTRAMDTFDLGKQHGGLEGAFARSRSDYLVLSFSSDWLFPTYQSKEMVNAMIKSGRKASFAEIQSPYGHDSFLLEHELQDKYIRAFLDDLEYDEVNQVSPGDNKDSGDGR
jgi:homoserine O-acetyltransferase